MKNQFDITLQNRKNLHYVLENTPKTELLTIPKGFRNNIWWNMAHVVVTQQLLLYKFSNLQMRVPEEWVNKFRKGTVPDGTATDEEIKIIGDFLIATAHWAEEDYEKGLFKEYTAYTTSANVLLQSVEDAIAFNVFHEGLHFGTILSLQKSIGNPA